jgi:hypothetical protein
MGIEYRLISLFPTCVGNERIRITDDGEVSHSRNTVECERGERWSASWRTVGRLDPRAAARLTQEIVGTGLLDLPPQSIDESAQGGKREEIDLTIDRDERHFVAQNTDPQPFRAVVTLLWGVLFELER